MDINEIDFPVFEDSLEKRMSRLLDFYGKSRLFAELNITESDLFKPEIIEIILEKTKARQSWLIDGEGDPFLEHEDYIDKYIKTEEDMDWLINRNLAINKKDPEEE